MINCLRQCVVILALLIFSSAYAEEKKITLALHDANLSDAIRLIAKFLDKNIVISPLVVGTASLNLSNANSSQALQLLLTTHGLAAWQLGNIWFIAPRAELIKRKQEELKWQEISAETAPLVTQMWKIKYGKAEEIAHLLQDEHAAFVSKRGRVRVDVRTNIICIKDLPEVVASAQRMIKYLDVPVKQILIEARLASVDNDYERELGIDFTVQANSADTDQSVTNLRKGAGRYSLAVAKLADSSLLDVKLSALENAGHAELISSPSLFTTNQQTASIESGEEIPYQEISDSGGTAVTFKKAVLGLKVTPQVLPGNKVLLQLQINQDRPNSRMVLGVPTISTRQINTSVLVKANQTVVLGGIYETNNEKNEQRVPFISRVPLIGLLFTRQSKRENKRELLIFVTPRIITSAL